MKRIVVKIGSSVIAPEGLLDSKLINVLVKDILKTESLGYKVILVTSGAIACGINALGFSGRPQDINTLMALSSVGQILLMDTLNAKFKKYKRMCAQILLTHDDFNNRKTFVNTRNTVLKLFSMGIIPVINENDAISHEEIRFGDNDRLSALVADLVSADLLIMLSDVEGLFDGAELVKRVERVDKKVESMVKRKSRAHTSGGMDTKLEAATIANLSGIPARIASGRANGVISEIASGGDIGTLFLAAPRVERPRKRWIQGKPIRGSVTIDEGAKKAVLDRGKSLLSVGITYVTKGFKKNDTVAIVGADGCVLGYGLVNYDSEELSGVKSKKLQKEVVHRDNFVKAAQGWCYHPYRRFVKAARNKRAE